MRREITDGRLAITREMRRILKKSYVPCLYAAGDRIVWDKQHAYNTDGNEVFLDGALGRTMRRLVREGFFGDLSHVANNAGLWYEVHDVLRGYPASGLDRAQCRKVRLPFPVVPGSEDKE